MKIFSFDAEPERLYGAPFAIGAVVLAPGSNDPIDQFAGWIEPKEPLHSWAQVRIVAVRPFAFPLYSTREELLEAFWQFWLKHREGAVCVSDWGSPVESGVMRLCVAMNPDEREFLGPAPLHEVSTALLTAGIDADTDRIAMAGIPGLIKHNPVHDALASAICFRDALRLVSEKRHLT
jgi:hypothetical protein